MPRIMISATGTNCGKTSIVCGLLKILKDRGMNVKAYKCGPDYIDGMFIPLSFKILSKPQTIEVCLKF